jgi:inorganic pyrophosphatase
VDFHKIPPRDEETGLVNVVIDTPRGSRNKYKLDEALGLFKLARILPEGHYFPFDFGSIPGTRAEDGDALDVMVLMDEPAFVGCLLRVRLVGVLTARQTQMRKTIRNDRLLAVPQTETNQPAVRSIDDVDRERIRQIEHFFVSYNAAQGRTFKPGRPQGVRAAEKRLREAIVRLRRDGVKLTP